MPGVFIHANVASQIINAALARRPLLRAYNEVIEFSLVLSIGIIGIIISWGLTSSMAIAFYTCAIGIILIVVCYQAFLLGWWLPLVPALLTLIVVVIAAILVRNKQRERLRFKLTLELILEKSQINLIVVKIALENFKRSENKANSHLIEKQIKRLTID